MMPINITWNESFNSIAVTFIVQKSAPVACTAAITFGKGHAANYNRYALNGTTQLPYQLYSDSGLTSILKDQPDITSTNDYVSVSFTATANQQKTLTYYFQIPFASATTPTFKPYGSYADNVSIKVFENPTTPTSLNTANPVTAATLNMNLTIPQIIEMCFGTSSSGFNPANITQTLNFGDISSSKTQTTGILIRSNAGYAISMSSTNNGVMKNTSNPSSSSIPYQINFNGGSNSTLTSSPTLEVTGSGQTSDSGNGYSLSITTTTTPSAMNGNYSDSISITAITTQ
jgi:hypothetical protein